MSIQTSSKMLRCSVFVLLLIGTIVNSIAWPQDERNQKILKCPSTSSCTCIEYSEMEIQCPRFEPRVFVRIQQNNYVHFECENITNNEFEMVPEIKLEETRFLQITKCPLPNGKSVASYLKNIHIDRIRSFQFVSNGVNQNIPVESQHFNNLGGIEMFDLRGIENEIKELPPDLFLGMQKLTWVRIRVANIHLPVDLFSPLTNLEFLELGHNKLQKLEPGFLRNQQKLQKLNLWGNLLRNLNKDSFVGLDLVNELDLSANGMESIAFDLLFHLSNLTDINLSTNNFAFLPDDLFANNRKLRNFRLLENRVMMETLPNGLLANLTNLETVLIKSDLKKIPQNLFEGSEKIVIIRLDHNAIDDLPPNIFKDQMKLENLDLSSNLISNLPNELFLGTTALKELKLSKNRLTRISSYLLKPLAKLTHLYLDDNNISDLESKALSNIKSIEFITLQNNQLNFGSIGEAVLGEEKIKIGLGSPFQLLEHLVTLNLVNNSITAMFEDFTLTSLKSLNLSYNHISTLSTDDFQSISRDRLVIDLTHNRIEEIDFNPIEDVSTPSITVLLNDNPMTCDCRILHFVRYIKHRNYTDTENSIKVSIGDLRCAKPSEVANKLISDLTPMELVCSLDSEETSVKRCPNDCSCQVRLDDKHLLIECASNVNFAQLPIASKLNLHQTELKIENNNLTKLPSNPSPGYKEITKLFVGGNEISEITIENLPTNLRILDLHENNLATLNVSVMNFISNSSSIEQLTLRDNPWECDCSNLDFMNFVQNLRLKVVDYSEIKCKDGRFFNTLKPSDLCTDDRFIAIVSITLAVFSILICGPAAIFYKYQKQIKMWLYSHNTCLWFVTEEELDKDKRYDAFVSYSHRDQDYVADYLLPELENGTIPYKLCVHERDWSPGLEISTQISNSVNDAKRTIIVMSPNYLQSNWAQWEFRVAQSHAATEKRSRIIVILYGDIGDINKLEPDIRDYLKLNTYVKWGDKWFWEKLKYAMPHIKSSERAEKSRGLVKTVIKSSIDDKLELIKPISITPPQLTTPPAEKLANPLITTLIAIDPNQNSEAYNSYDGHINGAFIINTSSRQSDV